jgi:hypothetical protein
VAKRRFDLPPRGMTDADVAGYLNRSLTWFMQHKAELIAAGFPSKLPIIDLYDLRQVDAWLDKQGDPNERLRREWASGWQQKAAANG